MNTTSDSSAVYAQDCGLAVLPRRWSWARVATSMLFLVDGMSFGTWAALIPSFQQKFGLSHGDLSWVLAAMVVGALISMPVTGRLVARFGSLRVATTASLIFPAGLLMLAWAPSYPLLAVCAGLFGAFKGLMDVSINSQGITVENAGTKPVFSSFQGFWSSGGLVSAGLISLALRQGIPAKTLLVSMAGLLVLMSCTALGRLLPDPPLASPRPAKPRRFKLPSRRLMHLGVLGFLGLFSEGVLLDWSAVYAHDVIDVSVATAPIAFAVFSVSMAVGRFFGDFLLARFGPAKTMRISGLLMTGGMVFAVAVRGWIPVLIGFAVVGFGIANLVPIVFGAAAKSHADGAGPGLATVTTIGFTGFLCGPPLVGWLAAWFGLPVAFCIVVVFGIVLATIGSATVQAREMRDAAAE